MRIRVGNEWVIRWVSLRSKDQLLVIGDKEPGNYERLIEEMSDGNTGVRIKDRRYHFRVYKKCFLGNEAVDWLMNNKKANTVEESVEILRCVMEEGLMEHVQFDHLPKNEKLFYRFVYPTFRRNLNQYAQYLSGIYLNKCKLVVSQSHKFIIFSFHNMLPPLLNFGDGSKKLVNKKIEKEYGVIKMKIPAVSNLKIRSWIFALYEVISHDKIEINGPLENQNDIENSLEDETSDNEIAENKTKISNTPEPNNESVSISDNITPRSMEILPKLELSSSSHNENNTLEDTKENNLNPASEIDEEKSESKVNDPSQQVIF